MLPQSQVPDTVQYVIPERLLITLHDAGVRLAESDNGLLHWWGLHLLEDCKSLQLLAQKQARD